MTNLFRTAAAPAALAAVLLAAAVPAAGWVPPPFTLQPSPPEPGDTLRCVVDAPLHASPVRSDGFVETLPTGTVIVVVGAVAEDGTSWIADRRGFVPAAYLDRAPTPFPDLPEAGAEGMAAGRVLPDDWRPADLVEVTADFKAPGYGWRTMHLRRGAEGAFRALIEAAAVDGVRIGIVSAFRSADYQRGLYARALARDPGQRASSAPGRSEHQLGTTADVATPGTEPFRTALAGTAAGQWLREHAARFGIVATFGRERHAGRGVAWEPWHLRWVGTRVEDETGW